MKYEDLNQLGNTFDRGYGDVWSWWQDTVVKPASDIISDIAIAATEATGTTQAVSTAGTWVENKASEITATTKAELERFQKAVEDYYRLDKQVEEAIASLPEGAEKNRLLEKNVQANGLFVNYVLPVWNKFVEWTGMKSQADFGFLPAIPAGYITASALVGLIAVAFKYLNDSRSIKEQILKDPALSKEFVATYYKGFDFGKIGPYLGLGVAAVAGIALLSYSGVLSTKR